MKPAFVPLAALLLTSQVVLSAAELQFAGSLGNSGDIGPHQARMVGKVAPGMGPVLDGRDTLWERAGSRQLNRYALDGRVLASFEIADSDDRTDQLTLVGNTLLMKLRRAVFALPVDAKAGTKPTRLPGDVEAMSSSALGNKVVIFVNGELRWLDVQGARTPLLKIDFKPNSLEIDASGTVFAFGEGKVRAWKNAVSVAGFPKPFNGERPQKLGSYWFSHAWHGTINRFNESFEPSPGVVLGGASGSFIGYLPQSADLTNGRGMAQIRDGLYAASGMGGVLQLMKWNPTEERLEVVRRIGALSGITAIALDAEGNVWTPRGAWRWTAESATPHALGDKEPDACAQPVVLAGRQLVMLKKHYNYVQLARGPLLDANGLSHFETPGIKDFDLSPTISGAAVFLDGKTRRLIAVERGGKAFELSITEAGQQASSPEPASLPGLKNCTSLAWFADRLLAADSGRVIVFERSGKAAWREVSHFVKTRGDAWIHSDGRRLVVADSLAGSVQVHESLSTPTKPVARYTGLDQPTHLAIAGDRIAVVEAGAQRVVRLELSPAGASRRRTATALKASAIPNSANRVQHGETDFEDIGRPGGLPIAVVVSNSSKGLTVSVRSSMTKDGQVVKPAIKLGVANDKQAFTLAREGTSRDRNDNQFDFVFPTGNWSQLQLAVTVTYPTQQERFGFNDHQAIHAPFNDDASTWATFDLDGYRERVAERQQEIRITFDQAESGKASIIIENAAGQRVRNLVSGRAFVSGRHTVVWDGLDEQGVLVTPGNYHWRGITHAGIKPAYRMNFANGNEPTTEPWGPNHSTLHQAAANKDFVFFAAPVTEGGWSLVALDAQGKFVQGYEHQQGLGIMHDAIAVDDQYLYVAQDGFGWGGTRSVNMADTKWIAEWKLTLVRFDIRSGKLVEWPGKQRFIEVDAMKVGPGSAHPDLTSFNLGGIAVLKDKLYVGSRDKGAVFVLDAATGKRLEAETIKLAGVRHLAVDSKAQEIIAATDRGVIGLRDQRVIVSVDSIGKKSGGSVRNISGITVATDGDIWLSDEDAHQVYHFDVKGKLVGVLGTPGGPYRGAYDPQRMVHPAGLVFGSDGKLWVTEKRWNPKRVLAWDIAQKKVVYEKFGMPHYGGDGSGFDPENPRRWIGLGCFWDVDIEKGTARPTHVMSLEEGHLGSYEPQSYTFFREAGRTFISTRGKLALISEVLADGSVRDIAATAGTHHFSYALNWQPPQAYIDAFYAKWPDKRRNEKPGPKGEGKPWAQRGMGVLWVDRNGDGQAQQTEFDFCGDEIDFAGSAWGHLQSSLTFYVPVADKRQVKIAAIKPRGFLANGVPDYPKLDDAITQATPVSLTPGNKRSGVATMRDAAGRFIFNSDPEMNAYAADGRHLWRFPNQWSDVHGSHDAPLPEPGVMQGTLAILGHAPFDKDGEVFFLNGNHGRCFLLTSDGIYLDEAFVDVRVSYLKNEYRLGGEIFGGSFGRDARSGRYYVQIGHGPYRIYEVTGLDKARRIRGEIDVAAAQIAAAEKQSLRQAAARHTSREATLPGTIRWDKSGKFRVQLDLASDATHLHLTYRVEDSSPWVNNGRDWLKLFATGDSVDLQLAADLTADPKRRDAAPGDRRLLIAPFEGKPLAVLYEHRKPAGLGANKAQLNPVEFNSPWRGAKVDNVRRLPNAQINVKVDSSSYTVTAAIPLQDLGFTPTKGKSYRADFGVTYGDAEGTDTNLRNYWSNQSTMLVDDIPGEIMLMPHLWGTLTYGP